MTHDGRPWYRQIGGEQWRTLFGTWGVWALDAIDYLSITFVLADIAATFHVSLSSTSLLLFATMSVRWLGGLLFGSFSDRVGRKMPLLICLTWFSLGAVFTGLAWNFASLVVIRTLLGFGMAPGFSLGATMVAESWPPRYRALGIGFLDTGWGIGAIGASLIYGWVYPHFGWRGIFFVGSLPALLLGVFIYLRVPESPLWESRGKGAGGSPVTAALLLFKNYPRRVSLLALMMVVLYFGSWPFQGLFPTYLKTAGIPVASITMITTIAASGQIMGFLLSGVFAEYLGRRAALIGMILVGSALTVALVRVAPQLRPTEALAFLTALFLVGSSGIWGTVLAESLPAAVRATGVGFLYNVGAAGGGIAPFVVLASLDVTHSSLPQGIGAFTVGAALLGVAIVWCVPETRGKDLEAH